MSMMTAGLFSLAGVGGILIGLCVVGAIIYCVSASDDDASVLSGFLRHRQGKRESRRENGKSP
jgi:hypothetical protein